MKELVETIVKAIVNNPDKVKVEMSDSVDFPGLQIIRIDVANEDLGIVIGKRGRTIGAIRDLVTISAIRNQVRVKVLVNEDESDRKARQESKREEKEMPTEEVSTSDDSIDEELGI
jgi:predicted RNA-binding protein YlqC (UPF0109 family)